MGELFHRKNAQGRYSNGRVDTQELLHRRDQKSLYIVHRVAFAHPYLHTQRRVFTYRNSYRGKSSRWEAVTPCKRLYITKYDDKQKLVHTKALLHIQAFAQCSFYTRKLLRRAAFTQSSFYTEDLDYRGALHRQVFPEMLSHTGTFAQRHLYTD